MTPSQWRRRTQGDSPGRTINDSVMSSATA
jgi:hypothetical protein